MVGATVNSRDVEREGMRIGIDAHMIGDHSGGNESYYSGILRELEIDDGDECFIFLKKGTPAGMYEKKFHIVYFESKWPIIRNFVELNYLCKKYRLDMLHTQYYIPFFCPCKRIVTIHDICFEHYKNIFRKTEYIRNKLLIPYAARKADRIVTVSNFSKKDIVDTYGVEDKKIEVMSNAVDSDFRILSEEEGKGSDIREKYGIGKQPFVLCVGNLQPRKNIPRLVEAFLQYKKEKQEELKLVLVGKKAWLYDKTLAWAKEDEENIQLTGYVEKEDLVSLLNEAQGFLYPSYFEGFGIPPLEAMACGTPIAVADIEVMHEVVGEQAVFFDPFDTRDIRSAIEKLCRIDRKEMSKKANSSRFSWEKSARRLKELYKDVYDRME